MNTTSTAVRTWEEYSEVEQLQCLYSDFYKDVFGFRPRGASQQQWNSAEWLNAQLQWLKHEAETVAEYQQKRIVDFEKSVFEALKAGAADRNAAIRWVLADYRSVHEDCCIDVDYACYSLGLPDGYLNEYKISHYRKA